MYGDDIVRVCIERCGVAVKIWIDELYLFVSTRWERDSRWERIDVALEEPDGANCRQQRVIDLVPSGECQQHLLISSKQQA